MESLDSRKQQFNSWLLNECGLEAPMITQMPGDASFRRYYRVISLNKSFVAMDAPPPETVQSFVAIGKALAKHGLRTPEIYVADMQRGFLLLTDFGDDTYLRILNRDNANQLYRRALTALVQLQDCRFIPGNELPSFGIELMQKEWMWHKEWFMNKWLQIALSNQEMLAIDRCYERIVESVSKQTQVFMHRDYHSANLMRLSTGEVGILDFQDAFMGPITYDAVSLLRDCYISWPEERVQSWLTYYFDLLIEKNVFAISKDQFVEWFDWMGVQRQLKALLTFARKEVRDNQSNYLQHIPRTLNNLLRVTAGYSELKPIYSYLQQCAEETISREVLACAQ